MKKEQKETLFTEVFQANRDRLYRLCCGYLNDENDIDDLMQEIMLNIWKNLDSFRGEAQISTWIFRIAVNTAQQTGGSLNYRNYRPAFAD